MQIINTVEEMQKFSDLAREEKKTIGLVPTMGYLHEGHLSLIKRAGKECDIVIVSIYVNPTQFGPNEDLSKYPHDFQRDKTICIENNVNAIFCPTDDSMYQQGYQTFVNVENLTKSLCGKSRPTHFKGVTTIVSKLFNCTKPHKAYFGQKDYQQTRVIKQMTRNLNYNVDIIVCPIIREKDGLAMSSRNRYLNEEERKSALVLSRSLDLAKKLIDKGETNPEKIQREMVKLIESENSTRIDYIELVDVDNLTPKDRIEGKILIALAVFVGKTRLIDNLLV